MEGGRLEAQRGSNGVEYLLFEGGGNRKFENPAFDFLTAN
jgi:hypothetical protein